jgi:hypothetical protein
MRGWYKNSAEQHRAARFFANRCAELETDPGPPTEWPTGIDDEMIILFPYDEDKEIEHRSSALATILTSVSFMEASLNELFASASDDSLPFGGGQGPLTREERDALLYYWQKADRKSLLTKCAGVLEVLGKDKIDKGSRLWQDADLLVKLRNMLVHHKPVWRPIDDPTLDDDPVVKRLLLKRFPANPFLDGAESYFPDRCLGGACANWALRTAEECCGDFFRRLGVRPM